MAGISQNLLSQQSGQTKSAQLYWTQQTKNIQGRPRNTEVKQHSKGHIAGQWPRCEKHQDFPDIQFSVWAYAASLQKPKQSITILNQMPCVWPLHSWNKRVKPNLRGQLFIPYTLKETLWISWPLINCAFLKKCCHLLLFMILFS